MNQGYNSMTLASDCFRSARDRCLNGRFYRDLMPQLPNEIDEFCRNAYRGGISYLKPEYEDKEIEHIKVFDVNSLYPWVMHDCPLPVGYGTFVDEQPTDGSLYFVNFKCEFLVKDNRFPFLQLKNNVSFRPNQFVKFSNGEVELCLTSVDYKNFINNYDVYDAHDFTYLKFKSQVGLLAPHVDYWMQKKIEYEQQGMPFMRYIAKTFMNGFYGKTALRPKRLNVIPEIDPETNQISYSNKEVNETEPIYIPYGAFVTAWARDKLINSALAIWDDFIYCDTDSIHCFERDNYPIDIHPKKLGYWKDETATKSYDYARYIKQKTYCHANLEMVDGKPFKRVVELKAAGLNNNARQDKITGEYKISIDDFKYGLTLEGVNLKTKTVPGGAILDRVDWALEPTNISDDAYLEFKKLMECQVDG